MRLIFLPAPGVQTIVTGHLEILFRAMLHQHFNKFNGGKSALYVSIVFIMIIVEGDRFTVVGFDPA